MAISSGWVGSSAVNETGQRWMSAAMEAVRLGRPAWMSQMVGRSKEVYYSIGSNHSYNKDTLISYLRSQGSTPVVITITGDIVSHSASVPCLDFPSDLANEYVTLIINGGVHVWGRGGKGGDGSTNASTGTGQAGGTAINNGIGTRLRITNNGAICGGGGGGGGAYYSYYPIVGLVMGGGGGRPYGAAGAYSNMEIGSTAATYTAPGRGSSNGKIYYAGNGGDVGQAGAKANDSWYDGTGRAGVPWPGGAAGKAVSGNSPRWDKVGTTYGSRV